MPRQSGHTTAALQLMYEYPDALMIVHSGSAKSYIRQLRDEYISDKEVCSRIEANTLVPSRDAIARIPSKWTRPFIIIDQASMVSQEQIGYVLASLQGSIVLELG